MGGDSEILDGGAMCVMPCCQIVQLMDLSLMSLHIETPEKQPTAGQRPGVVYTKDGVPIQVTSVAQVRIGPPPEIGGDDSEAALPSVLATRDCSAGKDRDFRAVSAKIPDRRPRVCAAQHGGTRNCDT